MCATSFYVTLFDFYFWIKVDRGCREIELHKNVFWFCVQPLFWDHGFTQKRGCTDNYYFYLCATTCLQSLFWDTGVWFLSIKEVAQIIIFSKCVRPVQILHKKEVAQIFIFSKCVQPLLYTIILEDFWYWSPGAEY